MIPASLFTVSSENNINKRMCFYGKAGSEDAKKDPDKCFFFCYIGRSIIFSSGVIYAQIYD